MKTQEFETAWTYNDFKSELRHVLGVDNWGTSMDCWFECAGQMNKRGLYTPIEWNYSPPMGSDGTDEESHFYECFENMGEPYLIKCGTFLYKYTRLLEKYGHSY